MGEALAARHGRTVRWHAILLGATFQAAELRSPVGYPLKREYSLRDFRRSARFEGVPDAAGGVLDPDDPCRARVLMAQRQPQCGTGHRLGALACAPISPAA